MRHPPPPADTGGVDAGIVAGVRIIRVAGRAVASEEDCAAALTAAGAEFEV
eukprot:gene40873-3532_t